MSTGSTTRDAAELEAFLIRQSTIATEYDNLELVEPPAALDEKILGIAKTAARLAVKQATPQPAATKPKPGQSVVFPPAAGASAAIPPNAAERPKPSPAPIPGTGDEADAPASSRPRWLLPAALALTVAVGAGLAVFMESPTGTSDTALDDSLFAKRARERRDEAKATAAASAAQDAEAVVRDSVPLPPPPVFEPEGPQVQDLDAAIVLVRKEVLLLNQTAAVAEEAAASQEAAQKTPDAARNQQSAVPADRVADTAAAPPSVIQPRERRLTKILELYDGGNPDLAADSLEIFLRDFPDDPVSQRILKAKP